jgi:AcrR family transcriptional regulator
MPHDASAASPLLTSRGASTRERVLQSGARVLAENGYAGTTLADIAARAGTKAGSLYYYFSSREDLIREIMTRGVVEIHENVSAAVDALPEGASSRQRLAAAIAQHVHYMLTQNDLARAAIRTLGQAPAEVQGPAIELHRVYGQYLAGLIDAAAADGYLPQQTDSRVLRLLIVGAANWTTAWYDPRGTASVEDIAGALVTMTLGEDALDVVPAED